MTTTAALRRVLLAAAVTERGMRFVYCNHVTDRWVLVDWQTPGPDWTDTFDDWTDVTYADGDDAMLALVDHDAFIGAPDVDAADALRRRTVSVYDRICTLTDGEITDRAGVFARIRNDVGTQMTAQRALRELRAIPSRPVVQPTALTGAGADDDWYGFEITTPPVPAADPVDPIPLHDGRAYRPRTLFGGTDVEVLRALRGLDHVRLSGPPGAGKTTLVDAAFGDDVITVQGHADLTVAALYGQYLPGHGTAAWEWFDGPLLRAMREGKVLLIDELNRAPSDVDEALLSATDDRRTVIVSDRPDLPRVVAAPGFMVVATYNDADRGTRPLSAGLLRRLNVHVRVETDFDVARADGIDPDLLLVAANLRTSATAVSHRRGRASAWYPQMADLRGAQRLLGFGAQAAFTALTASCDDPERLTAAAASFGSVFGVDVDAVASLGARATVPVPTP